MQTGTLYEAHLVVRDLQAAARFYETVLGFSPALCAPDVRFYWTESDHSRMFALWQLKPDDNEPRRHTRPDVSVWVRSHIAFHLRLSDFWAAVKRLRQSGVRVTGFEDNSTEPSVHCWVPAVSVYFSDPDGHALELISILDEKPQPKLGVLSWSKWQKSITNE